MKEERRDPMRITDVRTSKELAEFMTTPTDSLVQFMRNLHGDLLVLGAGGKMGPDLLETVARADGLAGTDRRLAAAGRTPRWRRRESMGGA